MIIYDCECFKYDWMICWIDTDTQKEHFIVNDKEKLLSMYKYYKNEIWVGYNSRHYDKFIIQGILCGFDPYDISDFIINQDKKGYEYSKMLSNFPFNNYDCSLAFKSLKELEGFMGDDIRETSVPFDIDRKLTREELLATLEYCKHDIRETFKVFVKSGQEFTSHFGLIKEYNLPLADIGRTKAQLSAKILGAVKQERNDEFDISFPDTLRMGKYEYIKDYYVKWGAEIQDYEQIGYSTDIAGVPHKLGIGGLHGAIDNYFGEGHFLMADVASFYPAIMIEYNFLSRNVVNPKRFTEIRDERIIMKANKDPRQQPRKIILNSTFGASKDTYNNLYDPLMSNNVCIAGQLLLIDLIDKLEGKCELIQSNTDGILIKLFHKDDEGLIKSICNEWCKRTRMELEFDRYTKVFQSDVNNYLIIPEGDLYDSKGKERFKRKGAYVKKLYDLDNDLPIVNKAIVDYLVKNIPIRKTIIECDELMMFQKVTKISSKYEYAWNNETIYKERVLRYFASTDQLKTPVLKLKKGKETMDRVANTPNHVFIYNDDVKNKPCPTELDKQWYIDLANKRLLNFLGGNV